MKYQHALLAAAVLVAPAIAQEAPPAAAGLLDEQERRIRDRYEQVLERNPYQESAFDRVYEGYMLGEGVDAWLDKLGASEGEETPTADLVLRGRIHARQLRPREAITALERVRERGESPPALNRLLGHLYYEEGRDEQAIELLSATLDSAENPEERSRLSRILGNVYLRSGRQEEAVAAWERIVEMSPGDFFALQELAEIYEANRLWERAAGAYQQIAAAAADDPYQQCRALQAIGKARVAMEDYAGAIAAFEAGLDLAAPGNWLFEDLKDRLVSVYESMGDLEGLSAYLQARLEQHPAELEFQELLAETYMRQGDAVAAERVLQEVIARSPDRDSAREMRLRLYENEGRLEELAATFESLISRYPAVPDYLRRLGEVYLRNNKPEEALSTWRRIAGDAAPAEDVVLLAEWLERYEFYPEAAEAYGRALELKPDREWALRLAGLRYDMGEEEAALSAWRAAVAAEDTPAAELAEVASILRSHEFNEDAKALYERAMAMAPDGFDHLLSYARLLVAEDDHEGAIVQFERLAAQDENEYFKTSGEQGLLDAYVATGVIEAKRAEWEQAVQDRPNEIAPRLKLARLYARSGNRPGAVALYEASAAAEPENVEIQRRLAEAYRLNRQDGKAIETLEGLMEADPSRAGGYLRDLLGLHASANHKDEAIATAERLVEMTPGSAEARAELASVYMRYGERDKALQQYRNVIQIDSDETAYYREFGEALEQTQRHGEASEVYRRMLEIATDAAQRLDAVGHLALVYARLGQGQALLREFQEKVRATPKNLAVYEELAAIHNALGDRKAAMETIESARDEIEDQQAFLKALLAEAYDAADYTKVVSAYEELIALSAEPTIHDLERLGQSHARAGNLDRAVEVWEKLAADHREDREAQIMVARALREQGYFDEAQPYIERALELEPYDYHLRFQHAQDLLNRGEPGEAAQQLRLILEIGEQPPREDGSNVPLSSPMPLGNTMSLGGFGQRSYMPVYQRSFGAGFFPGSFPAGYGGRAAMLSAHRSGQPGAFEQMKNTVLQTEVQMAQNQGDVDALLKEFRDRAEADPDNIDARYDYLAVCEFAGQQDTALEVALGLREIHAGDTALLWRILRLQQQQDPEAALETAKTLAEADDKNTAMQALFTILQIETQLGHTEGTEAAIERLKSAHGDDAGVRMRIAHTLHQLGRTEEAEAMYAQAAEADPRLTMQIEMTIGQLYASRGEMERARAHYATVLFHEPEQPAATTYGRNPNAPVIHLPQFYSGGVQRPSSGNFSRLPGASFQQVDHHKEQAFNQIIQMTLEDESLAPLRERLRQEATAVATAETPEEVRRGEVYLNMYIAYLRNTLGAEAALAALEEVSGEQEGGLLARNLRLYLLEDLGMYSEMGSIYDTLATEPGVSPTYIAQARLNVALATEDFASVGARYQDYIAAGGNAAFLPQVVGVLDRGGASEQSIALLEENLTGARTPDTLNVLANIYSGRGEHERAIALADEAWHAISGGGSRLGPRNMYPQYHSGGRRGGSNLQSMGLQHLLTLWNVYEQAGRADALIEQFEEKLSGQPASVTLHKTLIGLHSQNNRRDLAQQQMEKLVELRPNDFQIRMQYADLLEENGKASQALEIYELAARERPYGWRAYGGQIQRLYRELNKTEALESFQERLITEARTPEQMQELAQQFANEEDFDKAAELLQRAARMQPANEWLGFQVADYYWRAEEKEKALTAYLAYLDQDGSVQNVTGQSRVFGTIVSRFKEAGRLEELEARVAGEATTPVIARRHEFVAVHIAEDKEAYDEAEARLMAMLDDSPQDGQIYDMLARIAEKEEAYEKAIEYLKKTMPGRGFGDLQRLAQLHLKLGDETQAVDLLRRHAEQRGGFHGHNEAIQTLLRADAVSAAEMYFMQVFDRIPSGDWAYRQLADTVLQEFTDRQRMSQATVDKIFERETPHLGQFAERLTQNYHNRPDLARERLEGIAERFPENEQVQSRYAEILSHAGAKAEAVKIYKWLSEIGQRQDHYFQQYISLLTELGRNEERKDALAARLVRDANPSATLVRMVAEAFLEMGELAALNVLREQVLAVAPPAERPRLDADFARVLNPDGARTALKAQYEANPSQENMREYLTYLIGQNLYEEMAVLYREHLSNGGSNQLSIRDVGALVSALIAAGEAEEAWRLLLESSQREQSIHELTRQVSDAIDAMRTYGSSSQAYYRLRDTLRAKEALTLNERLFIAAVEAHLGHTKAAIDVLQVDVRDYRVDEAIRAIVRESDAAVRQGIVADDGTAPSNLKPQEIALDGALAALREDNVAGAIAMLDAMEFEGTSTGYRLQRAHHYLRAEAWDKAIADCRAIIEAEGRSESAVVGLTLGLAGAGKSEEAIEAWRSIEHNRDHEAIRVAKALADAGAYAAAQEVLGSVSQVDNPDTSVPVLAARILHESGESAEIPELMESRYSTFFGNWRDQFHQEYGSFLDATGLWETFLTNVTPEDEALNGALLVVAQQFQGQEAEDKRLRIVEALADVQWERHPQLVAYAQLLDGLGRREAAIAALSAGKSLAQDDPHAIYNIAQHLAGYGAHGPAVAVLDEGAARYPALLKRYDGQLIQYIAAAKETPAAEALFEKMQAASYPEAARTYNKALLAFARGDDEAGWEAYNALLVSEDAEKDWLTRIAGAFEADGKLEQAIQALERLREPGAFSEAAADEAASYLAVLHGKMGNYEKALRVYVDMLPANQQFAAAARRAVLGNASNAPFKAMEEILLAAVEEAPSHPRVSELLVLREQLAEAQGLDVPGVDGSALGISAAESYEFALWSGLIDTWAVSPPTEANSWEEMTTPLEAPLAAWLGEAGEARPAMDGWVQANPHDIYPTLDFAHIDWVTKPRNNSRHAAYAAAEIESPDERTVTLAHGSDDRSRVWLNGEEVFSNPNGRICVLDQDRAEVTLKPGTNRILVQCGNIRSTWEFSLSISSNAEGLEYRLPVSPDTTE